MTAVLEALGDCAGIVGIGAVIYALGKAQEARSRRHHPARGGDR